MTCTRASKFLDAHALEVKELVPASRKLGRDVARQMCRVASRVVVSKGKATRELVPGKDPEDEIVEAMLGPTGNLRAPTMRVGRTVLVGFDEASFARHLKTGG